MSEDILTAINRGDFSEKEIRLAVSRIPSENLAKYLDFFILFQERIHSLRSLTRKWALSVKQEHLNDKLECFIRHQESEDEDVRSLAWDLADKISEDVLIENISMLLRYQEFDDEDVRSLTWELALKIDPDKLIDKLDLIDSICQESKNQEVCRLAEKLIKNAKGTIEEENVQTIINLLTS
jgi:hypothetical protein